jgi:hypothetical protein
MKFRVLMALLSALTAARAQQWAIQVNDQTNCDESIFAVGNNQCFIANQVSQNGVASANTIVITNQCVCPEFTLHLFDGTACSGDLVGDL